MPGSMPGQTKHYREAGPRVYCAQCPVYKKDDKLDCKNYWETYLFNVLYKIFANILYDRVLSQANAAVQHYKAGFQSGK
jgi:hypothetical protein